MIDRSSATVSIYNQHFPTFLDGFHFSRLGFSIWKSKKIQYVVQYRKCLRFLPNFLWHTIREIAKNAFFVTPLLPPKSKYRVENWHKVFSVDKLLNALLQVQFDFLTPLFGYTFLFPYLIPPPPQSIVWSVAAFW